MFRKAYFASTADLDSCIASGDWTAAFVDVPGDPAPPPRPSSPPPRPSPALQLAFAPAGTDLAHFALQALYEDRAAPSSGTMASTPSTPSLARPPPTPSATAPPLPT
ncbi:hypothetical protein AB1Y20_009505 [Prymnesium parvum]|uniref:Uncharacterized protein n=1 Tax=Prymnesium parvum TaxID=97485 RepID=A0AB34K4E8_PRYPA